MKLTKKQREVLELLKGGAVMTIDEQNLPSIGAMAIHPQTRYFLTSKRLVTRQDQSKNVNTKSNGFVISEKGIAALAEQEAGEMVGRGAGEGGTVMSDAEFEAFVRREEIRDAQFEAVQVVKRFLPTMSKQCKQIVSAFVQAKRGLPGDQHWLPHVAALVPLSPEERERLILAWGEELKAGTRRQ